MMQGDARAAAIQVLKEVLDSGVSLTAALNQLKPIALSDAQRSLAKALCYGVMRWYLRLDFILLRLLQAPLRKRESDIRILLLIGLYQLMEQRAPDYACVSEAVDTAKRLKKDWAKALVNGVLRNYIRQREQILQEIESKPDIRYACPRWLVDHIQQDWPEEADSILRAGNQQAPMTLRINLGKLTVRTYLQQLLQQGHEAKPVANISGAVQLYKPCDAESLPGFEQGLVAVQDAAAQLAAVLLDVQPGDCVLDACAAPGGKSVHILESQSQLKRLFAVDVDRQRLDRVKENVQRMAADLIDRVQLDCADLLDLEAWWDGQMFDRILLDAPCSASGVIRRHPDIKFLRRQADIDALCAAQQRLLHTLWPLLKPGGRLLYATCSVLKAENEFQIETFIKSISENNNDSSNAVQLLEMKVPYALARQTGFQLLPGVNDMDGFYYAGLLKLS